ncbi:hypothetical protein GCM10009800_37430 [Nocardiopsis rhodophaea]
MNPSNRHQCAPPTRKVTRTVYGRFGGWTLHTTHEPDGQRGTLWRCRTCRRWWRIGNTCDHCDENPNEHHPGPCSVGTRWRRATLRDRLRLALAARRTAKT